MASYLATGGAGFIGSHLAVELLRGGQRVRIGDNLITGSLSNLAEARSAEFPGGDLAAADVAERAVGQAMYRLSGTQFQPTYGLSRPGDVHDTQADIAGRPATIMRGRPERQPRF